jgi:hypothetical protein
MEPLHWQAYKAYISLADTVLQAVSTPYGTIAEALLLINRSACSMPLPLNLDDPDFLGSRSSSGRHFGVSKLLPLKLN